MGVEADHKQDTARLAHTGRLVRMGSREAGPAHRVRDTHKAGWLVQEAVVEEAAW